MTTRMWCSMTRTYGSDAWLTAQGIGIQPYQEALAAFLSTGKLTAP